MDSQIITTEKVCPLTKIAAYVDGELSPREELELELHLANCQSCAAELNEQKKLLCALDFALEKEAEIELPVNFTKIVVANAESKVNGLRCPRERFKALFAGSLLFLAVILGLGGRIEAVLNTYVKFGEQIFAVGAFALHLIYDVSIGTAVILRSLDNQFVSSSSIAFALSIAFFFVSLLAASRLSVGYNRT